MWMYFYTLTFLKVLLLFLKASECLSDSFSKVPIGFGSSADSLNKDLQTFHKRCNRIEDVKLTLQEWSDIILVSFAHSSLSSSLPPAFYSTSTTNAEIPHQEEHKNPLMLTFTVNKTTYDLPLRLYRESYREALKITLHANETFARAVPKNCHYFGSTWKSRRTPPISAFINLCSKTSGLILFGGDTFTIKSLEFEICEQQNESSRSHIAFKIPTTTDEKHTNLDPVCGNELWAWKRFQGSFVHRAEFLRNLKIGKSKKQNKKSSHCLMIKLGVVLDHSLINKLNASVEDIKQQMLLLSNILNQFLKELHKNIQIELVHLDLWKDVDLFPTSLGARWMLSSLVENAGLFADAEGIAFHYLHLLSGQLMESPHYGASIPDSICTDRAVGFSYVENPDDIVSMAAGIMHMLGHVIGLEHDGSDSGYSKSKKCSDQRGFAMSPKRLLYFPNVQTPSWLNRSDNRISKNKRNNNNSSHSHDNHHRHRHHHFHLGWSSCSQHEFGLNVKSGFLGCLKDQCVQHHHHQREQSQDAPSKGNSRFADRSNRSDGYVATAVEDNDDGSEDDDDDDISLPGGGNGFKKNFFAKCGNGILERGEECDCSSFEDCLASDPCCDHRTCLLKPWATCRRGACCTNCTLSASNHVCREMKSLCDVPEFCTGNSEECPEDSLVLDGQPCMRLDAGDYEIANDSDTARERGLCYEGRCRSYDQQCAAIWGSNSSKASDGCFSTFNLIGAISGHCGLSPISLSSSTLSSSMALTSLEAEETLSGLMLSSSSSASPSTSTSLPFSSSVSSSTEFIKCSQRDVKCGLLHCKGGPQKPLVGDADSFRFETTITSFGKSYQCKVLSDPSNPQLNLVEDGSPCSKDSMCISNKCTAIAEVVNGSDRCPRGENNLTCSGNGVCTDKLDCFCFREFSGKDCSSSTNRTKVPSTPADEFSETLSAGKIIQYFNNNDSAFNKTYRVDKVTLDNMRNTANALWLLGAMSCVIVGASAILILCLICYRRKTPKLTKKQQICQLRNQSLMCKSVCDTSSRVNRIISFGSLPSYRADKLRKAMKGSNHSETESEKSSKRNSGEVNIKFGKEAKATYLPLPDPPDKGILKRPESKSQRRNRAATQEEAAANTGSDVSSIPGDSAVCGSGKAKREKVNDAKKVRNVIDMPSESSLINQNVNRSRDEGKSLRNSLATMPDILPKVSENIQPIEVKGILSETSKRDNSKILSQNILIESDLKGETKSMICENLPKRSKVGGKIIEECSFVDGTGTMSSFLSTSDLEASPHPIAPAPSLCSEYSPQPLPTSKNAPVSFSTQPLVIPKAEQQNNLKSYANNEASSSSPNSCSTFTSSLSEALAHDVSQISEFNKKRDSSFLPSRRSADRASKCSTKETTKRTNPAGVSECDRVESSAFLSSHTAPSCVHRQRDEMPTSLQLKTCWDSQEHSFNKSTNCSSPQHLEKLSIRGRNSNADVFKPDPRGAYTKAPGSPGAPDDDD